MKVTTKIVKHPSKGEILLSIKYNTGAVIHHAVRPIDVKSETAHEDAIRSVFPDVALEISPCYTSHTELKMWTVFPDA